MALPARPLASDDLYEVPGLLDAADLLSLAALDLPDLKDPPFFPHAPAVLRHASFAFRGTTPAPIDQAP